MWTKLVCYIVKLKNSMTAKIATSLNNFKVSIDVFVLFIHYFKRYFSFIEAVDLSKHCMVNFFKNMALNLDTLSTQKAKILIQYFSEFLVVLWPKYVTLYQTERLSRNTKKKKKGHTIFFEISIGLCVQI